MLASRAARSTSKLFGVIRFSDSSKASALFSSVVQAHASSGKRSDSVKAEERSNRIAVAKEIIERYSRHAPSTESGDVSAPLSSEGGFHYHHLLVAAIDDNYPSQTMP
jgi:hypothetical protein